MNNKVIRKTFKLTSSKGGPCEIPKELLTIVKNSHNVLRISIPAGLMKGLTKGVHKIKLYLKNRITPIEIEIEVV